MRISSSPRIQPDRRRRIPRTRASTRRAPRPDGHRTHAAQLPPHKRLRRAYQKHVGNRIGRTLLTLGIAPRIFALLETTGRRTGEPRRTPVGNGLVKGTTTFWLISEFGMQSGYVQNLVAKPQVRVKVGRRWITGTAQPPPDDDARARLRQMAAFNAAAVRFFGSESDLLTIRIDLDSA